MGYYVIFFDEDYTIKLAHKSKVYPKVGNLVYLFKSLEKSELKDIENLMMDIITEEEFTKLSV